MALDRTASMLEAVEVAASTGALVGPTESFLAQYLAVVLYSEMEDQVSTAIKNHLATYTHESVAEFVSSTMADILKRLPKSDISRLTARFGDRFKERFNSEVEERIVTMYSNVIAARHDIGHKRGSNITLKEVKDGHFAANHILEILEKCLSELGGAEGSRLNA